MPFQVRQNLERLSSLLQRDVTTKAAASANEDTASAPLQAPKVVAEQENKEQKDEKIRKDEF